MPKQCGLESGIKSKHDYIGHGGPPGGHGWGPGIPARDVTLVQPVAIKPVGHPIAAVPIGGRPLGGHFGGNYGPPGPPPLPPIGKGIPHHIPQRPIYNPQPKPLPLPGPPYPGPNYGVPLNKPYVGSIGNGLPIGASGKVIEHVHHHVHHTPAAGAAPGTIL